MGDLNDETVDHPYQLPRYRLLQKAELRLFEPTEDIVVTVAVLGHLHVSPVVTVDFVGCRDDGRLGNEVDPGVDDRVALLGGGIGRPAILVD